MVAVVWLADAARIGDPTLNERAVDVAVDKEGEIQSGEFVVAGNPPRGFGAGVNHCDFGLGMSQWKCFKPSQAIGAELVACPCGHFLDLVEHVAELGQVGGELLQGLPAEEHFVGVTVDAGPVEVPDLVENFGRVSAGVGEVSALKDEVGGGFTQVCEDGFEGGEIAVDVRNNCDAHRVTGNDPIRAGRDRLQSTDRLSSS